MLSAIVGWLGSQGLSLILGAVVKLALDGFNSWQASQTQTALGRAQSDRDQAAAGRDAAERELAAEHNAPKTTDDALTRLEDGTA